MQRAPSQCHRDSIQGFPIRHTDNQLVIRAAPNHLPPHHQSELVPPNPPTTRSLDYPYQTQAHSFPTNSHRPRASEQTRQQSMLVINQEFVTTQTFPGGSCLNSTSKDTRHDSSQSLWTSIITQPNTQPNDATAFVASSLIKPATDSRSTSAPWSRSTLCNSLSGVPKCSHRAVGRRSADTSDKPGQAALSEWTRATEQSLKP